MRDSYPQDLLSSPQSCKDADFSHATLVGASFQSVDFDGAIFADADLSRADFLHVALELLAGADFVSARYDGETIFPDGFDPVARGMINVPEADPALGIAMASLCLGGRSRTRRRGRRPTSE